MDLINKIKSLRENTSNEYLKITCNSYLNSIQLMVAVNENDVAKNFLANVTELDLSENDKSFILNKFKVYNISNLGLLEAIDSIIDDSEIAIDPIYEERIEYIKKIVTDNEGADYRVIQRVVEVLNTLPSEDLVVNEAYNKLSKVLAENTDDIIVMNFINYVTDSSDRNKYKKQYDEVLQKTNDYIIKPDAYTKSNLIEALRQIPQTNEIKTFSNYIAAKVFSGDTYNHNMHIGNNSLVTGRTKTSYFNNIGKSATEHGIGNIVMERLTEANKMLSEMPRRKVLELLVESINNSGCKLNSVEKKIYNSILIENQVVDLGLYSSIKNIRKNSLVYSKYPLVKKTLDEIYSRIDEGVQDYKLVYDFGNILSPYKYDYVIEKQLEEVTKRFKLNEGRILAVEFLETTDDKNKLGLYSNLRKDLVDYIQSPTAIRRQAILENYSKLSYDLYANKFLSNMSNVQDGAVNKKNFIINEKPEEYIVENVYSFFEKKGNKEHFNIGNKYFVRNADDMYVVNENNVSPKVKMLTETFNGLNLKVVNESKIRGFYNGYKLNIDTMENENSISINETKYDNLDREMLTMTLRNAYRRDYHKMLDFYTVYENLDSLIQLDNISKITYRKNPKVYCYVYKLDESIHLQFVNESLGLEKFAKTKNSKTATNWVKQYIGFDISKSISDFMSENDKKIVDVTKKANSKLDTINKYNDILEKIKTQLRDVPNGYMKDELNETIEGIESEVEELRNSYSDDIEALDAYDNAENGLQVGLKVKSSISQMIGNIISIMPNGNCLVQFEDGSQKEQLCSDLIPIIKDYKPETIYGSSETIGTEETETETPTTDLTDEMSAHRFNKFKKKD